MRKIYEMKIGTLAENFNFNKGTPNIFINKDIAFCRKCYCKMQFNFMTYYDNITEITCPKCGRRYVKNEIMYTNEKNKYLPWETKIKILEYKNKIILKIKYFGMYPFNLDINNLGKSLNFSIIEEEYIFDILNKNVIFKKKINNKNEKTIDTVINIGYLTDYEKLKYNTALWFYYIDNKTTSEEKNFTKMLKILREKIIEKEKNINGYSKRSLYISKVSLQHKVFFNILNLAFHIRFWDTNNDNLYNNEDFINFKKEYIDNFDLSNIDEEIYNLMQNKKMSYHKAYCTHLKLPYRKNVLTSTYKDICLLKIVYKIKDLNVADELYEYTLSIIENYIENYINMKDFCTDLAKIIDFYNAVILKIYPQINIVKFLKKNHILCSKSNSVEILDIINLWKQSNNKIKKNVVKNIDFKHLHDFLSIEVAKQKDRERSFKISKDILNKYNISINNNTFQCINKLSKLKKIAYDMKNCSASYREKIDNNLQLVAVNDKNNKSIALLEIENDILLQAKMPFNKRVLEEKSVNELIINFAKRLNLIIGTKDIYVG